jgi:hypothetical protein
MNRNKEVQSGEGMKKGLDLLDRNDIENYSSNKDVVSIAVL